MPIIIIIIIIIIIPVDSITNMYMHIYIERERERERDRNIWSSASQAFRIRDDRPVSSATVLHRRRPKHPDP